MNGLVTSAELLATAENIPWNGWYCRNHPRGEELANDRTRDRCWGCDALKPMEKEETSMSEFKPGDVVRLKSGGPAMTVDEIEKKGTAVSVFCFWFDGAQLEDGEFAPASLALVAPEQPTPAIALIPPEIAT
jgi:uncharacterized protein YodC (DUF2158 family)